MKKAVARSFSPCIPRTSDKVDMLGIPENIGAAYIHNCHVTIKECTFTDKKTAVVSIDFENFSDISTSLYVNAKINALQNGRALTPLNHLPANLGIENNSFVNIKPGETISTATAFRLKDDSSPITVQICCGANAEAISQKIFDIQK